MGGLLGETIRNGTLRLEKFKVVQGTKSTLLHAKAKNHPLGKSSTI